MTSTLTKSVWQMAHTFRSLPTLIWYWWGNLNRLNFGHHLGSLTKKIEKTWDIDWPWDVQLAFASTQWKPVHCCSQLYLVLSLFCLLLLSWVYNPYSFYTIISGQSTVRPVCVNRLMDSKLFHTLKEIVESKYGICPTNPTIEMRGNIDSYTNQLLRVNLRLLYHHIDSRVSILSVIFEAVTVILDW